MPRKTAIRRTPRNQGEQTMNRSPVMNTTYLSGENQAPAPDARTDEDTAVLLVVDDEFGPRESLRIIFDRMYEVVTAEDGYDALEKMKDIQPTVILSDIRMPQMDGVDLMHEVRRQRPDIPFIIITGCASVESAQEAVRAGAFDYIIKPYNVKDIRAVVQRAVEHVRRQKRSQQMQAELQRMNAELQAQLRNLERQSEVGELSAELVHELNNPLTILQGYVTLLEDSLHRTSGRLDEGAKQFIEIIRFQIQRCTQLTRNFLNFVRGQQTEWEQVDCNELIRDTLFLLLVKMKAMGIRVEESLDRGIPLILAQKASLQQVIYNLLLNAAQALEGTCGGWVRLETRMVRLENGAEGVEIVVMDNGPGIPEEIKSRIFDTLFTTKPKGKGTGLGLAICRRVVREHQGTIVVDSRPGEGARFSIRLPILHSPPASESKKSS